jgi:SAM-dependent methyltransferase
MTWPAPERNKDPILEVLRRVLPARGTVLEVASGTGQHIVHFAGQLPGLQWMPSDPDAIHLRSIAARVAAANLTNVTEPMALDVLERPWPMERVGAVLCINMIHIAPWAAALALLQESARLLPARGVLFLYGPYRRGGRHTAPSNEAFDADLRSRNPEWGVRDLEQIELHAGQAGLALEEVVQMPANNLSVVLRRAS